MKRLIAWLAVMVAVLGVWFTEGVKAAYDYTVGFQARDITTNGTWGDKITVNPGDEIELKGTITNNKSGPIYDVHVMMAIANQSISKSIIPKFHLRATNAGAYIPVGLDVASSGAVMKYIIGSATVTKNGVTKPLNPDEDGKNITTQEIKIDDIQPGSGNAVSIYYRAILTTVVVKSPATTPTPTPGQEANTDNDSNTATGSAVAKTNPKTGIGDVWNQIGGWWWTLGFAGWQIRKKARNFLVK